MRTDPRRLHRTRRYLDATFPRVPDPDGLKRCWLLGRYGDLQVLLRWPDNPAPWQGVMWVAALWRGAATRHRPRPDVRLIPLLARTAGQLEQLLRHATGCGELPLLVASIHHRDGLGVRRSAVYGRYFGLSPTPDWPGWEHAFNLSPRLSADLEARRHVLWRQQMVYPGVHRVWRALTRSTPYRSRPRPRSKEIPAC